MMTPSKDVKDLIEGIYAFLSDTLKSENLSNGTDVLRQQLLSRIRKFAQASQSLRINLQNDENEKSSLGLRFDSQHINLNGLHRLSTSSGSTNYSNGFSGDDATSSPPTIVEDTSSADEDFYEEFEENNEFSSIRNSSSVESRSYVSENFHNTTKSFEDSSYSIVKNVPFRNLIARCDHHGIISKKSFLKTSRYFGVIADCLLYLYNKETDDKPKRVIALYEYTIGQNLQEDNKKKREFPIHLIAPGKKTHTFTLMTSKDRDQWMDLLNCAISTKNNCRNRINHLSPDNVDALNSDNSMSYIGHEYANDQIDDDVYEEITDSPLPHQRYSQSYENRLSPNTEESDEQHKYYEVPLEDDDGDVKSVCLPESDTPLHKKLLRPERPPLPDILKQKMDLSRPLPAEPVNRTSGENSYDPGIYWEIDNDSSFEKDDLSTINDVSLQSRSLSQEIFDTIKERVPLLPEDCHIQLSNHSSVELISDPIQYEVPNETHQNAKDQKYNTSTENIANDFHGNSIYQIPTNSWKVCDIYEIPPTPVPVLHIKPIVDEPPSEETSWNLNKAKSFPTVPCNINKSDHLLDSSSFGSEVSNDCEKRSHTEQSRDTVKELIQKLNKQQNKTEEHTPFRNSLRKISKTNVEEKCLRYQNKDISPSNINSDISIIEEKDIITISMQNSEINSSIVDIAAGTFIAKFAYVGNKPDELSYNRGDTIIVVDSSQNTWWEGELRGKRGVVNRDYLRRSDF